MKPREMYNAGTEQLQKGKLREAEHFLESTVAAQEAAIQPKALYNLGHVRFRQGEEELKKGPPAKPAARQGHTAVVNSQSAIKTAEDALQLKELKGMVNGLSERAGSPA